MSPFPPDPCKKVSLLANGQDYSAIKAYVGPIPEFSKSPSPEDNPNPIPNAGRKRKQAVGTASTRSSSIQAPVYEQARSPIAGPSHKRHQTRSLRETPIRQGGLGQGQRLASGLPSVPLGNTSYIPGDRFSQQPFEGNSNADDPLAGASGDMGAFEGAAFEGETASRNLSLDPSRPEVMGSGSSSAQSSSIPNVRDLLPDLPIQSIEGPQSFATGSATNATNSAFPPPQQQQYPQPGLPNPQARFPPGCTEAGAVARDDPVGVWYFDPHDDCQIRLGHRHDMNGGVWFTNELGVYQSLMAMRQTEGIGFLLGVATAAEVILNGGVARHLTENGGNINPRALMSEAARIVQDHVPAQVLDRESFRAPEVADVLRLSQTNSSLPADRFYDPFHRRTVRYDIPGSSATQGGSHGRGSAGGHQGGGSAGNSRASRQGTRAPGRSTS